MLRCRQPKSVAQFYVDHFGMTAHQVESSTVIGFEGPDANIELRAAKPQIDYEASPNDRYWKIGITVDDLDRTHHNLAKAGLEITDPEQFFDIGYMCHLKDSEGFTIELLQRTFQHARSHPQTASESAARPSNIGQITLRTSDIDASLAYYRDQTGMTLLSIQAVPQHGFTLYFLAFTEEAPPKNDLRAVENREWLWQRPYTTLELQAFDKPKDMFGIPDETNPGFSGIVIEDTVSRVEERDDAGCSVYFVRPSG